MVENADDERYKGKNGMYRWYVHDPIRFQSSIRMTIEHGHANDYVNDYSSVAYWYQHEPHGDFPQLPDARSRLLILPAQFYGAADVASAVIRLMAPQWRIVLDGGTMSESLRRASAAYHAAEEALHAGRHTEATALFEVALDCADPS